MLKCSRRIPIDRTTTIKKFEHSDFSSPMLRQKTSHQPDAAPQKWNEFWQGYMPTFPCHSANCRAPSLAPNTPGPKENCWYLFRCFCYFYLARTNLRRFSLLEFTPTSVSRNLPATHCLTDEQFFAPVASSRIFSFITNQSTPQLYSLVIR